MLTTKVNLELSSPRCPDHLLADFRNAAMSAGASRADVNALIREGARRAHRELTLVDIISPHCENGVSLD